MKSISNVAVASALFVAGNLAVQGQLIYTFDTDVEGFQNVSWSSTDPVSVATVPTVKQTHAAGGWQMLLTKEFAWGPGGGSDNQQLAMQDLANAGNAVLSFDVAVDGTSFPAGAGVWYQFNVVGNSSQTGWTQIDKLIEGWQNPDQSDLRTWHFDLAFSQLAWEPGDEWFQLYTGSNSDGAYPVNFYIDNVKAYIPVIPEPTTFALAGLGIAALLIRRRK